MNEIADDIGIFSDGIDCLLYPKEFNKLMPGIKPMPATQSLI